MADYPMASQHKERTPLMHGGLRSLHSPYAGDSPSIENSINIESPLLADVPDRDNQGMPSMDTNNEYTPPKWLIAMFGFGIALELTVLFMVGGPIVLTMVSYNSISFATLIFAGSLGKEALAATSLALLFSNITGHSLVQGMMTAIDTLGPNSFGAKNYKRVGRIVQRCTVICLALNIASIFLLWIHAGSLLRAFGIAEDVVVLSQQYTYALIPTLFLNTILNLQQKYLTAIAHTIPLTVVTVLQGALIFPLNLLFRAILTEPFLGPALAQGVTLLIANIYLLSWFYMTGYHKRTWPNWSKASLTHFGEILKLGLPGIGSLFSEWAGIELQTLLSGLLGVAYLGAMSVTQNIVYIHFMIPWGMSSSVASRVGSLLGSRRPFEAHRAAITNIVCSIIYEIFAVVFFSLYLLTIVGLFTSDAEVLRASKDLLVPFCIMIIFDGLQGTTAGVMRAAGQQFRCFLAAFAGYWLIALPLGYYLAFYPGSHYDLDNPLDTTRSSPLYPSVPGLALYGQWIAIPMASLFQLIINVLYISQIDWPTLSTEIAAREAAENGGTLLGTQDQRDSEDGDGDDDDDDDEREGEGGENGWVKDQRKTYGSMIIDESLHDANSTQYELPMNGYTNDDKEVKMESNAMMSATHGKRKQDSQVWGEQ